MSNTYNIRKIRVPEGSKKWFRNGHLGSGNEECYLCGRACTGQFYVYPDGGGDGLVKIKLYDEQFDGGYYYDLPCGTTVQNLGFYPVGSVCAQKLPPEFVGGVEELWCHVGGEQ